MTLEQAFPGLQKSPGGAILAAADHLFDLTGPANDAQAALADNWSRGIIDQIREIDPNWHYDRLGPVSSLAGKVNELNELRFQRAAAFLKVRGDARPLQVETMRFVQARADAAYDEGVALLKAGGLKARLSDREALGNYVDRQVRRDIRMRYVQLGIDPASSQVRVNRREYDSSGDERTYRRPDARVGDVALDVTLTRKTLATAQARGFFNADFRPSRVVIIRPRQVGADATYVISRPRTK